MFDAGVVPPDLMATLSSPVWMNEYAMVILREEPGSMPSVLRAVLGVNIFTPHAVKPLV